MSDWNAKDQITSLSLTSMATNLSRLATLANISEGSLALYLGASFSSVAILFAPGFVPLHVPLPEWLLPVLSVASKDLLPIMLKRYRDLWSCWGRTLPQGYLLKILQTAWKHTQAWSHTPGICLTTIYSCKSYLNCESYLTTKGVHILDRYWYYQVTVHLCPDVMSCHASKGRLCYFNLFLIRYNVLNTNFN